VLKPREILIEKNSIVVYFKLSRCYLQGVPKNYNFNNLKKSEMELK